MAKWRWGSWLAVVLLALVSLWHNGVGRQPVETDMLALLPATDPHPVAERAWQRFSDRLGRQLVFLIAADDWPRLTRAAEQLAQGLEAQDGLEVRRSRDIWSQWYQLYGPHRIGLLSETDRFRLQHESAADLWQQTQAQWLSPFAGISGAEIARDPLLLFRHFLQAQGRQLDGWQLRDGWLTRSQQGLQYILLSARSTRSPFSLDQQKLVAGIAALEQGIRDSSDVEIAHSGMVFYAVAGAQSARGEISRIGTLSLVGIALMILLVFRSFVPMALALLSLLIGMLAGAGATLMVFGKIHLLTLIFGCSLLGVAIDYTFHFLTERALGRHQWHAEVAMRQLRPALLIGLISTLIAYCALLVAPFPGLKQMAVFSCAGLTAAFVTVICCFPELAARSPSTDVSARLMGGVMCWFGSWRHPRRLYLSLLLLMTASLILWWGVRYDDDIGLLQSRPATLVAQEQRISSLTGSSGLAPVLVVSAGSAEANLQRLEQLRGQLQQWQTRGIIGSYQSPAQFLPSLARQQQNRDLSAKTYTALKPQMTALGLMPPVIQASPLTPERFFSQPVTEPLSLLWLPPEEAGSPYLSLVILRQLTDSAAVQAWADTQDEVYFVDRRQQLSDLFGLYRLRVMESLGVAGALLWILAIWRYGMRRGSRVALVPLLACVVALALSSALLPNLNLFNLLALLLVLGISLDFSVFSTESHRPGAAALSVTLAAVTSLLSFGLLALSSTQAVAGFGVTVAIGVSAAWWLAPLARSRVEEAK